jgi:hypothetical protein
MHSVHFSTVACERRDFRGAPEIKHMGMCMISPGPSMARPLLKIVLQQPACQVEAFK